MALPAFAVWGVPKGNNLIKHIVCALNVIVTASAIILIIIGALTLTDIGCTTFPYSNFIPAIIVIVAGVLLIAFVIVGCFGTINDSIPLLISYSVLLMLIFAMEITIIVLVAIYKDTIHKTAKDEINKLMADYNTNGTAKTCLDKMQEKLKCCGNNGPTDWHVEEIPKSCCYEDRTSDQPPKAWCLKYEERKYIHTEGCYKAVVKELSQNKTIILSVTIVLSCFKLISSILACWLAMRLNKERSY